MTLPLIPTRSQDTKTWLQRAAETINDILTFRFDDSRTRTAAEIAAGVYPVNSAYPPYDVRRYGADRTGATSSDAAFSAALSAAAADSHYTVTVPHGQYLFTGSPGISVPYGIHLIGLGSQGTTDPYGCVLLFNNGSGHGIVFDGNGADFRGTGGGVKNFTLLKADGASGGSALRLLATSTDRRPGEMIIDNIVAFGTGTGLWARGLDIDGSAATTAGSTGVRSIVGRKLRFADCTASNRYVSIFWGVHVTLEHLQVDQGDGTGTVGMTIDGDSDNVNLVGCVINGELDIDGNANNINIQGRVSSLDVNSTTVAGSFIGSNTTGCRNASVSFSVTSNLADAVFAYRTANSANVTGAGTQAAVICTTEAFDKNGSYNTTTGVYTAFVAGRHVIDYAVTLDELAAANTSGTLNLTHKNSGGTVLNSIDTLAGNVGAGRDAGDALTLQNSVILEMTEGDTVEIFVTVSGGAGDTVDIVGAAGTRYTYFSAKVYA